MIFGKKFGFLLAEITEDIISIILVKRLLPVFSLLSKVNEIFQLTYEWHLFRWKPIGNIYVFKFRKRIRLGPISTIYYMYSQIQFVVGVGGVYIQWSHVINIRQVSALLVWEAVGTCGTPYRVESTRGHLDTNFDGKEKYFLHYLDPNTILLFGLPLKTYPFWIHHQ